MGEAHNISYLFLTADEFPPYRPEMEVLIGGIFRDRGHKIDLIMRAEKDSTQYGLLKWNGFDAWVAPTNNGHRIVDKLKKHLLGLKNELRVFSAVVRKEYDFILVKDKFIGAIMCLLAARKKDTKYIYWLSYPFPEASLAQAEDSEGWHVYFYRIQSIIFDILLYRVICPSADHIVVQSEEMKRRMAVRRVPNAKMTALPMGVDSKYLEYKFDTTTNPIRTIVYIGTLQRERKLEFLLRSFALIATKMENIQLVLVGGSDNPDDKFFLERESKKLKIEKYISFVGFLPRNSALQYVAKATVCVSPIPPGPTYDVSSPTKTLEYMALGKPVVANDIPDTKVVLEGSGGGICTPYELKAFADGIEWLLNHPVEAKNMGLQGKDYIRRHRTYNILANELETCFTKLIADTHDA